MCANVCVRYLLGIMPDDLRLQLLGGAELEGQLKEGQPEEGEEKMRHVFLSVLSDILLLTKPTNTFRKLPSRHTDIKNTIKKTKKTNTCSCVLEDDVLHVGECGSDALQQQVERLDGDELLLPLLLQAVFSSGAQRETQVQLPREKHNKKTV